MITLNGPQGIVDKSSIKSRHRSEPPPFLAMPRFWEHLAPRPFSIKTGWSQKASKLATGAASQISWIPQNWNKCFLSKRNSLKKQLQVLSQLKIKTIVQHNWILYFVWAWHICFGENSLSSQSIQVKAMLSSHIMSNEDSFQITLGRSFLTCWIWDEMTRVDGLKGWKESAGSFVTCFLTKPA